MNENFNSFYEEEGLFESINRFEEMIRRNEVCYFDVFEFENIVDYYLEQHNYNNAISAIEKGLKQHPYSSSLKLRLAQIHIQNGKPSEGLHCLKEIEPVESSNYELYLLKGTALNVLGRIEEAHQAFDKAILLATDCKDDVVFSVACSYLNTRRYKLAIKYLHLAYEINPNNVEVIHEIALFYEKTDAPKKSIEYYKKYLNIDPFAEHIWFNLGMVYSGLEEYEMAINAYDFAIAISPDYVSAYFSKANTLVNLERYREAIESYEQILHIEPSNMQAYSYIGECYDKLGMHKRSIYYFRRAISIDKTFGDAWYGLGIAHYNMEEYSTSIEFFKEANKADPENPDYWYMLGETYRKLKQFDKSSESYNRAVELDPNDYEAWLSHADIFFSENKLTEAITLLNKAYEYNKDISTINYNLAAYYLYNNQPHLAGIYFEKGLLINYNEYGELFNRFPKVSNNETFCRLVKKYRKLSQ
jgi:tetratricopeptide (TPR) repeat protein